MCIFICAIIQLGLILYAKLSSILYEGKIHSINFDIFISYIYNVFVKSFLGMGLTKYFYFNYLAPEFNLYLISIFIIIIFTLLIFFFINFLSKKTFFNVRNKFVIFSMFYSLIASSFVVMIGGVGDYVGGRYAALPSFYLLTIVLVFYIYFSKVKLRYFFLIILIMSVSIGAYEFRPSKNIDNYKYIRFLDCEDCPDWQNEIINFNRDKSYLLKIWPYPRKTMSLN